MSQPLFNSLFDEVERRPLTVSELTESVRKAIEARFASVWVEGEISNFKAHSSGHWYFTIKDEGAQLRAKCFRSSNTRIRFRPQDGLHVISRRTRTVHVLFAPARVQGEGAGSDVARAIRFINQHHKQALAAGRADDVVDVLIVGRGGGSTED